MPNKESQAETKVDNSTTAEVSTSSPNAAKPPVGSSALQLATIQVNEDYCKEWNERITDFVVLTKNGELVNNSLYRIGGLNNPKVGVDKYFMLLKYVEVYYSKEILAMSKSNKPKHLEGRWCILDINGNEKIEFDRSLDYPYLVKDSCIYSIKSNYYNIETGEHYGYSSYSFQSKDFLFLDNKFEKDKSKCGVMKIDKKTGTWELFV